MASTFRSWESVKNDERSGCPQTSRTAKNIEKVSEAGRRFQSAYEIKSASQAELKDMAKNEFQKCFSMSITRSGKSELFLKGLISKEDAFQQFNWTATAGSDVVQSGRPIFDDFFQHLWPYIGNNTANVVFQMVKRLWLIRIDQ
ncbi:hypothetical protein TNCV_2987471 [Trichonephila clavipes]|nr:hypothetical protein TNCV_2987471 [Trichonephila clavipes]